MTECERIIEQGILPESFFKEETICDFFVDKNRKKIWAVGIDLLAKFDFVCRKHNLCYSLAFGSLLGCVRHNGFIPWDDDIDVFMPRKDYERLWLYKREFEYPYFLQFPGKDNGYAFSFAKLRNSNTTGISWAFRYESFNQGIYLDIFPLDNFNPNNIEKDIEQLKNLVAEGSALMRRSCPYPDENDLSKLEQFPIFRTCQDIVRDTDSLLRKYNNDNVDSYIAWSILTYHYKHIVYKKEMFDNLIEVVYYGHKVFIPRNYDEVLRNTYGDYLQLPPIDARGVWHSNSILNPDVPYKESQEKLWKEDRIMF